MTVPYTSAFGGSAPRRRPIVNEQDSPQRVMQAPQQAQQPAPAANTTFRQLQAQGVARPPSPAAPAAQPAPRFQGSQQANDVRGSLQASVQQALAAPSRYDAGTFRTLRDTAMADLENQFGRARSSLETDLARRGLSASSIAANNLYDLGGQQARALAGLNADLLREAATTQAGDRLAAQQAASNLAALAGSQDMAAFDANRLASQADFTNALAAAQFGQGQREFDVQAALDAARAEQTGGQAAEDLALRRELGVGQMDLSREELTQRFGAAEADRMLRAQEVAQQAALAREGRAFEGQQSDLARALQERLAGQQFGLDRERLTQAERLAMAEQGLTREQLAQQATLAREGQTFQGSQNELQRALQARLAEAELGFNRESLTQQGRLADAARIGQENAALAERALQSAIAGGEIGGRQTVAAREAEARIAQLGNDELFRQLALLLQIPGGLEALRGRGTGATAPAPVASSPTAPPSRGGGVVTGGTGFDGERFF